MRFSPCALLPQSALLATLLVCRAARAQEPFPRESPPATAFDSAAADRIPTRHQLDSLRALNPVSDARAAFARDDHRLWAIEGYSTVIPFTKGPLSALAKDPGYRVIPHTSDATLFISRHQPDGSIVLDSTHYHWQRTAYAYAQAYNRTMMSLLGDRARAF